MQKYRGKHMAEVLMGQAHLCERIAAECPDEDTAKKYKTLAQECRDAAAKHAENEKRQWPVVLAFGPDAPPAAHEPRRLFASQRNATLEPRNAKYAGRNAM
jgi:hypothetical protein